MKPAKGSLDLGVIVSDIKASLNFYQNILGLEFVGITSLLIEPKSVPPRGIIGLENQLGFRYVTFVIENLSQLCSDLKNEGIEFALPETEVRPGVRIAMVKDPDGNIVEFVERS
jgi:catechol 2,3-dioxygenase-like lactoylglutathione lyase family enzyme